MAIYTGDPITWDDFITKAYNAIVSACCNVDSVASLPSHITTNTPIRAATTTAEWKAHQKYQPDTRQKHTYAWNFTPSNGLIQAVSRETIYNNWIDFLKAADVLDQNGNSTRPNKLISAKDFTLVVGLFMQFFSYHVKPVYIRGSAIGATPFFSYKYVVNGGSTPLVPKYQSSGETSVESAEIDNSSLLDIIESNLDPNQLMKHYGQVDSYRSAIVGAGEI